MESPHSESVLRRSAEAVSGGGSDRMLRKLSQDSRPESLKGVDMYRTIVNKKQADEHIQLLKNKLDNLKRKEDHSLRLLEKAAMEEEMQSKARARKLEEDSAKQLLRTQQKLQQDQLKLKLKEAREEARRRRREQAVSVLKEKKNLVQTVKQERESIDSKTRQMSETHRLQKLQMKQEIRRSEELSQDNRLERRAQAIGRLQETYTELLDSQRSAHQMKLAEIKRLQELAAKAEEELKAKEAEWKNRPRHNPQLYPIAVLINDLKNAEKEKRLVAVSSLPTIAAALGPERTRSELVPYVSERLDDEEDVLLELAKQLGALAEAVGGKLHAHILFEPLHELTQVEDELVRQEAVRSITSIVATMDSPLVQDEVMEMCRRLAEADWYTLKVSAAALLAGCLGKLNRDLQGEALGLFADLAKDTNLIVRKYVGENLLKVVKTYPANMETQVLSVLSDIVADKEESVRMLAVQSISALSETLSQSKRNSLLLPLIRGLGDDKAWRVRYTVADQICKLAKAFSGDVLMGVVCPLYVGFLKDGESEVRVAACTRLSEFAAMIPLDQVTSQILPSLTPLVTDVEMVKAALACHVTKLCALVGRAQTNEFLLKHILDLLKDESSDIKLCIFKELESLKTIIGTDSLAQSVVPAISELAEAKQWRVRIQVLELMPTFARQLGAEFFDAHFHAVYLKFISDPVFSIREAVLKGLKELGLALGPGWVEGNILGALLDLKDHESYLLRITALQAVPVLCNAVPPEVQRASLLPLLRELVSDKVPNVRMNVAKAIAGMSKSLRDGSSQETFRSLLSVLSEDADIDVRQSAAGVSKDI